MVTKEDCKEFIIKTFIRNFHLWERRAERLAYFCNANNTSPDKVNIAFNNNWKRLSKKKYNYKECYLLGGTTFKYQVWAYV